MVSKSKKELYVQMTEKMYRKFEVEKVFGEATLNSEIFDTSTQKFVDRFLDGFNSSVFVYGQTGTGNFLVFLTGFLTLFAPFLVLLN